MRADITYKGMDYENVELASIKQSIVSFRLYTYEPNYYEDIELLVSEGADVDFYETHAFVIVPRENVSKIFTYKSL